MQKGEASLVVGSVVTPKIPSSDFDMADAGGSKEKTGTLHKVK